MENSLCEKIKDMLDKAGVKYSFFEHEESGPSNLSKEIRAKHGFPDAVGAKALVLVVTFRKDNLDENNSEKKNVLVVLPGHSQLDKKKLKNILPNMKEFRFATKEELLDLTGLVPGSVPPFGKPILPVDFFVLDKIFQDTNKIPEVGFNCARLDASVVMLTSEYLKVVKPDFLEFVSVD
jgi:prolyl-tRNA editing enzyme YbaK/EbsC (Cys-tRNA(Pro) deacylase)